MGSEYGNIVRVKIDSEGTFINKQKVSNIKIDEIKINWGEDMKLRVDSPEITENPGGVTIFGKGFGDYDQDIEVKIEYEQDKLNQKRQKKKIVP